jgi:hypothetical protein
MSMLSEDGEMEMAVDFEHGDIGEEKRRPLLKWVVFFWRRD